MSTDPLYDLKEPTHWAEAPSTYSFSTLQSLRACPRRWQLVRSAWGPHKRFPERPQPAAIEGQIVHEALDLLARELGRRGRPAIASAAFREAVERCRFWSFFGARIEDWNRRLASHPRAGPRYVLRTEPRALANQSVRLFREHYRAGTGESLSARAAELLGPEGCSGSSLVALLQRQGTLSEVRLEHPLLPVVGVLDLVALERDGSLTVVDFKTGARKHSHEEQVLLYALLWWRSTGLKPAKAQLQYLDSNWVAVPDEADLVTAEQSVTEAIERAIAALSERPARANPSRDCVWCPVRARCNDGWALVDRGSNALRASSGVDIELVVSSEPSPTGFLAKSCYGNELPVAFDAAVGCSLPPVNIGDRFRVVDASFSAERKEIALLPWTEMYRV